MLLDLVKGDAQKEAVARFLSTTVALNRTLAAPPGTPAERVALLRKAVEDTIRDPEFLAEAEKTGSEIIPMTGEETRAAVAQVLATPKDVIERVKPVLGVK
jgi:tripartite-type tricarboxylate transporter receptor subunit TctC